MKKQSPGFLFLMVLLLISAEMVLNYFVMYRVSNANTQSNIILAILLFHGVLVISLFFLPVILYIKRSHDEESSVFNRNTTIIFVMTLIVLVFFTLWNMMQYIYSLAGT